MKEIITLFKNNRQFIENFINSSFSRLHVKEINKTTAATFFQASNSAIMVYSVDENYNTSSPYFLKNSVITNRLGVSKKLYFDKVFFQDKNFYLTNPYISAVNGKANITYVQKTDFGYLVVDVDLVRVLEHLGFIEHHHFTHNLNKIVYGFMGFSLLFFSIFLGVYAIYVFMASVFDLNHFNLESTFKAIIALTLGLAIYDLAKTILEKEVFFKSIASDIKDDNNVFSKFLISIIIALSIESLMVVFKIALIDYTQMHNALFLIIGVSFLIFSLGKYNLYIRQN